VPWSFRVGEAGLEEAMAQGEDQDGAVSYGSAGVSGALSRQGARRFERAPYCIYSRADCCPEGFGEDELRLGCRGSGSISREDGDLGPGCDFARDP
jgi:hypothetical protein